MFDTIVFSNLCSYQLTNIHGPAMDIEKCKEFDGGILQQGLHSATVKYSDSVVQFNNDFLSSERNESTIKNFVLSKILYLLEEMEDYYLKSAFTSLSHRLKDDIEDLYSSIITNSIDYRVYFGNILFALYVIFMIGLIVISWIFFFHGIENELWESKKILVVIPPKIMIKNDSIRAYLSSNSSYNFPKRSTHKLNSVI